MTNEPSSAPVVPMISTAITHQIVIHPTNLTGSYRVTDRATGQEWTPKTKVPACDTARILLGLGASPNDRLEMFRDGRDRPDLTGSIGWFASHTVRDDDRRGLMMEKFRTFDVSRISAWAG